MCLEIHVAISYAPTLNRSLMPPSSHYIFFIEPFFFIFFSIPTLNRFALISLFFHWTGFLSSHYYFIKPIFYRLIIFLLNRFSIIFLTSTCWTGFLSSHYFSIFSLNWFSIIFSTSTLNRSLISLLFHRTERKFGHGASALLLLSQDFPLPMLRSHLLLPSLLRILDPVDSEGLCDPSPLDEKSALVGNVLIFLLACRFDFGSLLIPNRSSMT